MMSQFRLINVRLIIVIGGATSAVQKHDGFRAAAAAAVVGH